MENLINRILDLRQKMIILIKISENNGKINKEELSNALTEVGNIRCELKGSELKDEKVLFEVIDLLIDSLTLGLINN